MKNLAKFCALFCLLVAATSSHAEGLKHYNIYIDADFSHHQESSVSIERGLKVALSFSDNKIAGLPVKILRKDHRGNSTRTKRHLEEYHRDPNALLYVAGLHSPNLIAHLKKIHQQKTLVLVPWAAGGPITRYPSKENWIFRLSIDDSKAGQVLAEEITRRKFKKPFLLLEKTTWGETNKKNIETSLGKLGLKNVETLWFDWTIKKAGIKSLLIDAISAGADSLVLVSNANEGANIAQSMAILPKKERLPILSHWGIIGGNFHNEVPADTRKNIDLSFLQTKFSFLNDKQSKFQTSVFARAQKEFKGITSPQDILAPTGFIHAFDLMTLTIQAAKKIKGHQSISKSRDLIRLGLEKLNKPIEGLVKTYKKPFSPFTPKAPDAHEALGKDDIVFARFGPNNEIKLEGK